MKLTTKNSQRKHVRQCIRGRGYVPQPPEFDAYEQFSYTLTEYDGRLHCLDAALPLQRAAIELVVETATAEHCITCLLYTAISSTRRRLIST